MTELKQRDEESHRAAVAGHGHLVFESILTDVAEKLSKTGDLADGDSSVHIEGIVGKLPITQVGADHTRGASWPTTPLRAKSGILVSCRSKRP